MGIFRVWNGAGWGRVSRVRYGDRDILTGGAAVDLLNFTYATERTVTTTIQAAVEELRAEIGGTYFHPRVRHLIRIPPGTYTERVQINLHYVDLIGQGATPADVMIRWPNGESDPIRQYPLEWASSVTLKNVTVESGWNSYCIHADGGSIDAVLQVFENVHFVSPYNYPVGLGTPERGVQWFRDCTFDTSGDGRSIPPIFGHSDLTPTRGPGRTVFERPTFIMTPGSPLAQWTHWNTKRHDELWIDAPQAGSTVGVASYSIQAHEKPESTHHGRYYLDDAYTNVDATHPSSVVQGEPLPLIGDPNSAWWVYWSGRTRSRLTQPS